MTDTVEITRDAPLSASLQALTETYPDAPAAELRRFADARPDSQEDALALYAKYLAWREADGSAAALAEAAAPLGGTISEGFASLGPKTAGDRVLLVEGARYDSAFDHAAYVALLCSHMDAACAAADANRVVVVVDCRPCRGWPSPAGWSFLPLLRAILGTAPDCYPERLRTVVVFPVPYWAAMIMNTVTALLDPVTRDKIALVAGDTDVDTPCPAGVWDHVAADALPPRARCAAEAADRRPP